MDFTYWTSVFKRLVIVALAIIGTYVSFKIAIFYMPFLIAFIISLIIEPLIKKIMKKCKISRKASSILVFIITLGIIVALISWGAITIIRESNELLQGFNNYYEKINNQVQNIIENVSTNKIRLPQEMVSLIEKNSYTILENFSKYIQMFFSKVIDVITSIPNLAIYVAITILAVYFICTDKIYMLDELEHHLPENWMKEISKHIKDLIKVLGGYLKAQVILILVSFIVSLVRAIYFLFLRVECWISTFKCNWNSICRCVANFRFRYNYDTMGDYCRSKWRYKTWNRNCFTMDRYVGNKKFYRT